MLIICKLFISLFIVAIFCTYGVHGQIKDVFDLGCGTDYGCWLDTNFKVTWQPYNFRVYSTIGQFVKELKWTSKSEEDEYVGDFDLLIGNTSSVQILFGLSTDLRKELPFEVTECTLEWNNVEQRAQVEHFHINGYKQVQFHPEQVEVDDESVYVKDPVWMLTNKTFSQQQGFVGCYYDRAWYMKLENNSEDYLDIDKPYYLSLYVRSPLAKNNTLIHLATTSKRVYLTKIEVLSQGVDLPPFIDAHALMMVLAWGFLIPFGVAILKFLRYTSVYEMEVRGFSLLLIIHALINISGLILTVVAGMYMIVMTDGITVGLHSIFGTVVLCLCIIQCLLGLVHFVTYTSMKLYWVHRCLGGVLVFSSLLNIFLGIRRVVVSGASTGLYVFYMFLAGVVAVGYVAFEVYQCTTNRVMGSTPFWLLVFYVLILILLLVLFGIEFLSEFLGE